MTGLNRNSIQQTNHPTQMDLGFLDPYIRELYEKDTYMKFILKLCKGEEEVAEEVFQEGMIRLLKQIIAGTFKEEASLATFFMGICKNIYWDKKRRNKRHAIVRFESGKQLGYESSLPSVEEAWIEGEEQEERRSRLTKALHQLCEECRNLLMLKYVQKLSWKEIAGETGNRSIEALRQKGMQCRGKFRKYWQKQ